MYIKQVGSDSFIQFFSLSASLKIIVREMNSRVLHMMLLEGLLRTTLFVQAHIQNLNIFVSRDSLLFYLVIFEEACRSCAGRNFVVSKH
jgi:hypothetical protein